MLDSPNRLLLVGVSVLRACFALYLGYRRSAQPTTLHPRVPFSRGLKSYMHESHVSGTHLGLLRYTLIWALLVRNAVIFLPMIHCSPTSLPQLVIAGLKRELTRCTSWHWLSRALFGAVARPCSTSPILKFGRGYPVSRRSSGASSGWKFYAKPRDCSTREHGGRDGEHHKTAERTARCPRGLFSTP